MENVITLLRQQGWVGMVGPLKIETNFARHASTHYHVTAKDLIKDILWIGKMSKDNNSVISTTDISDFIRQFSVHCTMRENYDYPNASFRLDCIRKMDDRSFEILWK